MVLLRNEIVGAPTAWTFAEVAWLETDETKRKMDLGVFMGSSSTFLKKAYETAPKKTIYGVAQTMLLLVQELQNATSMYSTRMAAGLKAWLTSEEGLRAPIHQVVRLFLTKQPRAEIDRFAYSMSVEHFDLVEWLKLIAKELKIKVVTDYAVMTWVKDSMTKAVQGKMGWTAALLDSGVLDHRKQMERVTKALWGESEAIDRSAIREDLILAEQGRARSQVVKIDKGALRYAFGAYGPDSSKSGGAPGTGGGRPGAANKGKDGYGGRGKDGKGGGTLKQPVRAKRQTAKALRAEIKVLIDEFGSVEHRAQIDEICVFYATGNPCTGSVDAAKNECTWTSATGIGLTKRHVCLCKGSHPLAVCKKWRKK